MSATLLERVKTHIDAASLNAGYAVRYFRWTDAYVAGSTPFILYRQSGSGASDILLQDTRVSIILVGTPTTVVATDTRAQEILRYVRGSTVSTEGAVRFDPVGTVMGPMYLENGRPMFEVTVRVLTEDQ